MGDSTHSLGGARREGEDSRGEDFGEGPRGRIRREPDSARPEVGESVMLEDVCCCLDRRKCGGSVLSLTRPNSKKSQEKNLSSF